MPSCMTRDLNKCKSFLTAFVSPEACACLRLSTKLANRIEGYVLATPKKKIEIQQMKWLARLEPRSE